MKKVATFLVVCLAALSLRAQVIEGSDAVYLGGNLAGLSAKQEGTLETSQPKVLRFRSEKGTWELPYENIVKIVYSNKPGRQVAAAIAASAVTVAGPLILAAPKKKHYLTLQVKDEAGNLQMGAFEVSKKRYMALVADLEERTGLKAEYEIVSKAPGKSGH